MPKITQAEKDAIEAVKKAIKALPKTIWMETDEYSGEVQFWKRGGEYESDLAGVLKCRRVTER